MTAPAGNIKTNCIFEFQVWVNDRQWAIRTHNPSNTDIQYNEDSYDGTNCYAVSVFYTNKIPAGGNLCSAIIQSNKVPDEASFYAQPLWLGLASSHYFKDIQGNQINPIWHTSDLSLTYTNFTMAGVWRLSEVMPFLPDHVAYLGDGKGRFRDKQGVRKVVEYNPPYNKGFLEAEYTVIEHTNIGGMVLPKEFEFVRYTPKFAGESTNDLAILCKYKAVIEDFQPNADRTVFAPAITPPMYVEDRRLLFINPDATPVHYEITNETWPKSSHPFVQNLFTEKFDAAKAHPNTAPRHIPRIFIICLLVISTVIFAVLIRGSEKK